MKTIYKNLILAALSFIVCNNYISAQSIAAGGWHSLVICNDSTVKAFGENATGELGNGSTTDSNIPVAVTGLTGIVAVSGGGDQLEAHSMALKSNGTVWAWGSNLYGGLGNGTIGTANSTTSPVQVLLVSGIKAISAGGWHSVALKSDGTVWAWGSNSDGQIGDGTTTDKTIATQVPGLTGITKIAAGTYHTMALKNDGTVWAWGDNISGQIGDGTSSATINRTSPYQVSGLSGVVAIAAGRFYSLAVKNDGTVWTWGENLYGQLGDGTTADKSTPVQVSGLTGVTDAIVANGAFHTLAVKNDNTVWAWGRNTYGNLGDNTLTHRSLPVQMIGISNVSGLAAGTNFSLLYKTDGTFWACGRNASGQLGDGTFTQRNTATQSTGVCSILPNTVGVAENAAGIFADISIFPNPSSGQFTIKTMSVSGIENYEFEVYNVLGKQILVSTSKDLTNGLINISDQPTGIYYLTIRSGDHSTSKKLIKQ